MNVDPPLVPPYTQGGKPLGIPSLFPALGINKLIVSILFFRWLAGEETPDSLNQQEFFSLFKRGGGSI